MTSFKALTESPVNSTPSIYAYTSNNESDASDPQDSIPTIDFSLLNLIDPDQQSQAIQELDKACKDWGFFQVINHGVPETLTNMVIEKSNEYFNLLEEEKKDFEDNVYDPMRNGTSLNPSKEKVFYRRDFVKFIVHPEFYCPNKPSGFSEVVSTYSKRIREVAMGLLRGISTGLGLDQSYIEKDLELESGLQILVANLYPPCPQPDLSIGLPPHTDHGLLTLLINNGVDGLQIEHNGKWINVKDTYPNSFLVTTADQLEIISNGVYKSVVHRAVVNNEVMRISVAVFHGPPLDAVVRPACDLVDEKKDPMEYVSMTYKEFLKLHNKATRLTGKSV